VFVLWTGGIMLAAVIREQIWYSCVGALIQMAYRHVVRDGFEVSDRNELEAHGFPVVAILPAIVARTALAWSRRTYG
jgi:hypothetical protein